jgi:hypothetical protein
MVKSPVPSCLGLEFGIDPDRVIVANFAERVEIELSHKGREFIVLEELWDDLLFEDRRVLDDEAFAVFGP